MLTIFVHIVFGVCLLLSATSTDVKQEKQSKQFVDDTYEDHIEPMFSKEDN